MLGKYLLNEWILTNNHSVLLWRGDLERCVGRHVECGFAIHPEYLANINQQKSSLMFSLQFSPHLLSVLLEWKGKQKQFCSSSRGPLVLWNWLGGKIRASSAFALGTFPFLSPTWQCRLVSQLLVETPCFSQLSRMDAHYRFLSHTGDMGFTADRQWRVRDCPVSITGLCSQTPPAAPSFQPVQPAAVFLTYLQTRFGSWYCSWFWTTNFR